MDDLLGLSVSGSRSFRFYAVFGNPVLHSKSPQLYNSLFRYHSTDSFYTRIRAESGKAVCEIIRSLGLSGANITTPFKEEIIPFIDHISAEAETLSAVNTVVNEGGVLSGFNTDPHGVTGPLYEAGVNPSGMRCMVMGAGGAGKAAALGLINAGADVVISNRDLEKASNFARKAGCKYASLDEASKTLRSFDVLVLTLPPGVYPFDLKDIHADLIILDANYRRYGEYPAFPVKTSGYIKGGRWLLHQAVEAYRLFTGKIAETSVMEMALEQDIELSKLKIVPIRGSEPVAEKDIYSDMLVDGRCLSNEQINRLIDEEKSKAFGHKG